MKRLFDKDYKYFDPIASMVLTVYNHASKSAALFQDAPMQVPRPSCHNNT